MEQQRDDSGLGPVGTDPDRLKVLDIGTLVGGPFAAAILGDLGAEVIKVEPPGRGDFIRSIGHGKPGNSWHWQVHGRNKRSITLDLRRPEGQAVLRRLVGWADVLVENMRPGTMSGWGLGYPDLSAINPRLVYLSVSGWGQSGPYSEQPSYEFAAAAFAGLTYVTGFPDRPPVLPGVAIMDHTSAMFGVIGVLEAIRRREAAGPHGRGAHIDVALYEPAIRMANELIASYSVTGRPHEREGSIPSGSADPHISYGYVYETADRRYIACFSSTRAQFERLVTLIGRPDFATDSRLATEKQRLYTGFPIVDEVLRAWIRERKLDEVLAALRKAEVACAAVNGPAEIIADEHVVARGNLVELDDGEGGKTVVQAPIPRFDGEVPPVRWPAQKLGASNDAVYRGLLGMSDAEIETLRDAGVI
ncbi:crotonobetainyl-CoA:carnitine CoA-transferase CaiB-like acyl-CoA transferase [Amycolatopsis bartoniae]|uniref:CoA transferase n=1 Tax=Amycolatopsis bartoniae TaxID=941986 RepID=A0A8H9ITG7_9PSEU|nr:CoA transferase [Amycolatopsis bartoniae]MBB2939743.1 crotonobetainyl-CoA:carnitine CoA-transferase CaiB-like acyl-CoA transferase [Amycolatopsis bartoniae]TVT08360.1 CoA transferase [Amycolatopsis bartoniae]GHF36118.1 CoA transferase [Amycolatopsis bartoniae]